MLTKEQKDQGSGSQASSASRVGHEEFDELQKKAITTSDIDRSCSEE